MYFLDIILSLCLLNQMFVLVICENKINSKTVVSDDIEKRRSVKDFFDSLMTGSSHNTPTVHKTQPNPRSQGMGPIYQFMPYAVPMHSAPHSPPGPHMHPHHYPPSPPFGYTFRPPYLRPPMSMSMPSMPPSYAQSPPGPMAMSMSMPMSISAINQNYEPQSHHYSVPISHSHQDYDRTPRSLAIAIPIPMQYAIPLHLISSNNNNNNHNNDNNIKTNSYITNTEFPDDLSASTKYTVLSEPYNEEVNSDELFDDSGTQYKIVPTLKS